MSPAERRRYAAHVPGSSPTERMVPLPAGTFRTLEWAGDADSTMVFLHGLSGVAEVWEDTVAALGADRPRCVAIDQRGHGRSPRTPGAHAATDHLADVIALIERFGSRVHLVGHSMGARVAILAAARRPDLLHTATIVDIGPEAWAANIIATTGALSSLPRRFADRDAALVPGRASGRGERWAERFVDRRMRAEPDGTFTWLASIDGLIESVTTQRARNHWRDWERIDVPALLVRGGASNELRPRIAQEMLRRNPRVAFVELDDVGHNIPLLAPDRLAAELTRFLGVTAASDPGPTHEEER